jgi:hypothetical protein
MEKGIFGGGNENCSRPRVLKDSRDEISRLVANALVINGDGGNHAFSGKFSVGSSDQ